MSTATALLDPTPPQAERARVDAVFEMAEEMLGFVPAGMRLYGVSPSLLELFAGTVGYFRNGTALSPRLTAMIRYLVSDRADCRFCVDLNEGFLTSMGEDLEQVRAVRDDIARAPLDERERPLLQLALHAVTDPEQDAAALIAAARDAGWKEREIFDAVLQAASNRAFNHVLKTFNIETQDAFVGSDLH